MTDAVESMTGIRTRIEERRARMSDTMEQLGERLDPDRLRRELSANARERVDHAKNAVRDATIGRVQTMMQDAERQAGRAGNTVLNAIQQNPIPAAMVGVGLAWLITNARNAGHDRGIETGRPLEARGYLPPTYETEQGLGDRAGAMAGRAQEQASDLADRAGGAASRVAHQAQNVASRAVDEVQHAASQTRDQADRAMHAAQRGARRVEHRMEQAVRENPLAAGAVALALGLAAGLIVPETDKENEVLGPAHDRLLDRAQNAVQRTGEKIKHFAEETVHETQRTVTEKARDEGLIA